MPTPEHPSGTVGELLTLIHKSFDIDPTTIAPDAPLANYGLDSLSLAELLFTVEDHFHIDFPESRTDVQTLSGLAGVIDQLRSAQPA